MAALVLVAGLGVPAAWAGKQVLLGASDGMAADQPTVVFEVIDNANPAAPKSLGPATLNSAMLDTGASSVMVAGEAVTELSDAGLENVCKYVETGVAGTTEMDVSAPYEFDYAGTTGIRQSLDPIRFESAADLDLGDLSGIVGMPGMAGKVILADMSVWSGGNIDSMTTDFLSAPLPDAGHRYHVPLSFVTFPQSGQENPGDPLPPNAPLGFVHVVLRNGPKAVEGDFIMDTGAQLSVVSTAVASALGLDLAHPIDSIDVGGIGGTVTMPLVGCDQIGIETAENVDLVLNQLQLGVLDIDPSIAGVFGMDNLTSGWFDVISGTGTDGFYQKVQFDFRDLANGHGTLLIDVTPASDVVTEGPDLPAKRLPPPHPTRAYRRFRVIENGEHPLTHGKVLRALEMLHARSLRRH